MKFKLKKYVSTPAGILVSVALSGGIFLVVAIFYFYAYLPSLTNHGETITVPRVEGMQLSELEEFLGKRNLRYEVNDSSFSEDYPPLAILKQYPSPDSKVKEDRVIYISVNRVTPPTVPFPDLDLENGRSLKNVEEVLKNNELKRGRIELVHGPFLNWVEELRFNGRKIETGERIPKGSVIDLVVQDGGSKELSTPNVMGYTLEDAKIPIFGSSLNLADPVVVGDTLGNEPIVVLKQKPAPNENIRVGDIVYLWIGKRGTLVPEEDEQEELIAEDQEEEL
jgi:beta-lactam-binding protein with PASTA domain